MLNRRRTARIGPCDHEAPRRANRVPPDSVENLEGPAGPEQEIEQQEHQYHLREREIVIGTYDNASLTTRPANIAASIKRTLSAGLTGRLRVERSPIRNNATNAKNSAMNGMSNTAS